MEPTQRQPPLMTCRHGQIPAPDGSSSAQCFAQPSLPPMCRSGAPFSGDINEPCHGGCSSPLTVRSADAILIGMPHKSIRTGEADAYLESYPELRKWVNECARCHDRGRDPSMPPEVTKRASGGVITSAGGHNLRRMFPRELALDDLGLCEVCARLAG
jgi:hypothetical protein